MRLFTGIDLPDPIKERLDVLIGHLRGCAHIKWSPAYNLHITTKFIGEWPQEGVGELAAALRTAATGAPIEIAVRGLGWFPDARNPRVFWAGIEAAPALAELARLTDQALVPLGVEAETRRFSPHLTLARVKEPVPLDGLRKAITQLQSVDFGSFAAPCFCLYRSEPGPTGSIYTKIQEYPLPAA